MTDNEEKMTSAWDVIRKEFPDIYVMGCTAHCLQLLIKDIMKLEWCHDIFHVAKTGIEFIEHHEFTKHNIERLNAASRKSEGKRGLSLVKPNEARWANVLFVLRRAFKMRQDAQAGVCPSRALLVPRSRVCVHGVCMRASSSFHPPPTSILGSV